ncbi:cytochrome oxidase assembly protein 1 [Powellomyces hirtus]|nr:cytochrome oxidase assembly protein 1 [Powellomyces hirtus]
MSSTLGRFFSPRSPYPYLLAATAGLGWWTSVVLQNINSQKAHSGIFKAVIYHIRHDQQAREMLGDEITHDTKLHPSVKGKINMLKGNADVEFVVEGSKGLGMVHYRGRRGQDEWDSEIFTLTDSKGAKTLDLH